ncbi:hypothetical protein MRX96_015787 [Rhipicephalus microplus]
MPPEPKSPDDASEVANRMPTSMPQRRRLFSAAAQEESDLTRVMASWCWEQCNRAQHGSVFKDPRKVSSPKSFKEFADHLPSNLDAFRFNYSTLPFKSLTTGRWWWQIVVVLLHSVVYKTLDRRHRPPARRRRRILWQIRPKVSETKATGTEISGRCFGGRLSHAHLDSSAKAPLPGCRSGRVRPDPRNGFMVLGQCNRAQHWSVFKDPRKVLPPKSFKEFADRLPSNLDAFRFNYSTLPFKSLTTGRWCWQIVVVLLVCATFKLHNKRSAARTTSCWSPRR